MMSNNRPTIGLALRGASSRSVFNIGLLEVFQEQGLNIDYIAAMSGSAIVAAAYACGTLNQLREQALAFNKEVLSSLIEKSAGKGGMYNLDKMEELLRLFTQNKRFEEVQPLMGFVAVDIERGEEVVLSMGDIAHATRVTCTLPWVFEPVHWGNRVLIDGGVMNIVPGNVVQRAGIDIVIGVDLRNSKHIFGKSQLLIKRLLNRTKRLLLLNQTEKLWNQIADYLMSTDFFNQYQELQDYSGAHYPGKFGVLGRAMDLAVAAEKQAQGDTTYGCDLLIRPKFPHLPRWKRYLHLDLMDFRHTRELYELGRQTALEYLPRIWQMMAEHEEKQARVKASLEKIAQHN